MSLSCSNTPVKTLFTELKMWGTTAQSFKTRKPGWFASHAARNHILQPTSRKTECCRSSWVIEVSV